MAAPAHIIQQTSPIDIEAIAFVSGGIRGLGNNFGRHFNGYPHRADYRRGGDPQGAYRTPPIPQPLRRPAGRADQRVLSLAFSPKLLNRMSDGEGRLEAGRVVFPATSSRQYSRTGQTPPESRLDWGCTGALRQLALSSSENYLGGQIRVLYKVLYEIAGSSSAWPEHAPESSSKLFSGVGLREQGYVLVRWSVPLDDLIFGVT